MACQKYRNLGSTWQHKSSALFLHKKTIAVTALLKVLLWSTVAVQWTFKMSSMSALFCSLLNSTPSGTCGWFNKTCHLYQHIAVSAPEQGCMGGPKRVWNFCTTTPTLAWPPPDFWVVPKNLALASLAPPPASILLQKALNKLITE